MTRRAPPRAAARRRSSTADRRCTAGTTYVFFDPVARGSRGVADADLALAGAGCDSEGTAVVASLDLNGDEASDLVVTGRMGNAGEAWLLYGSP